MRGGMVKVFDRHGQDDGSNLGGMPEAVRDSQGSDRHGQDVDANGTSMSNALRHRQSFDPHV